MDPKRTTHEGDGADVGGGPFNAQQSCNKKKTASNAVARKEFARMSKRELKRKLQKKARRLLKTRALRAKARKRDETHFESTLLRAQKSDGRRRATATTNLKMIDDNNDDDNNDDDETDKKKSNDGRRGNYLYYYEKTGSHYLARQALLEEERKSAERRAQRIQRRAELDRAEAFRNDTLRSSACSGPSLRMGAPGARRLVCPRAADRVAILRSTRRGAALATATALHAALTTRAADLGSMGHETVPRMVFNSVVLQLGSLNTLNLRGNRLRTLPNDSAMSRLWSLKRLVLSHNELRRLPESIGALTRLETLDFTNNFVQTLPRSFTKLARLGEMYAGGNNVGQLPRTFGRLKSLRRVDLDDNSLDSLPGSFADLRRLVSLNLGRNELLSLAITPVAIAPPMDDAGRWEALLDEASNEIVYFNRTTRRCQRRRPRNFQMKIAHAKTGESGERGVVEGEETKSGPLSRRPNVPKLDLSLVKEGIIHDGPENEEDETKREAGAKLLGADDEEVEDRVGMEREFANIVASLGKTEYDRQISLASKEMSVWTVLRRGGDDVYVNRVTLETFSAATAAAAATAVGPTRTMPNDIDRLGYLARLKTIKVSGNGLARVPPSVGQCLALETLDVSMNRICELPRSLCRLSNLASLKLSHNRLETLPIDVGRLSSLEHLSVDNNSLVCLPSSVGDLSRLRQLNLGGNKLRRLPFEMKRLARLEHAVLAGNPLPGSLLELVREKGARGVLWHCRRCELESLRGAPPTVERVNIGVGGTISMPKPLVERELTRAYESARSTGSISLCWLNLSELPSELLDLASRLRELRLVGNPLTRLPEEISRLSSLRVLVLHGGALESLPRSIGDLAQLEELSLNDNKLVELPDGVTRLANLSTLSICNNRLTTLPVEIGRLESLKSLDVSVNQLRGLPESIGTLGRLELLEAGHNVIEELPSDMWGLAFLRRLHLNRNRLSVLPETLGDLRSLRVLKLAHNKIEDVPDEICGSRWLRRTLRVLWLHSNRIVRLPRHFHLLRALRTIRTDLNPMRSPPPGIVRAGIAQIGKYSKVRRRRVRALRRQFRALDVIFDTSALEPTPKCVLKSGTRNLVTEDLRAIDALVDTYVNADFYNHKDVTDASIVAFFKETASRRDVAYYKRVVDDFYTLVDLVRRYELLPGSLFTDHIKMPWGEKCPAASPQQNHKQMSGDRRPSPTRNRIGETNNGGGAVIATKTEDGKATDAAKHANNSNVEVGDVSADVLPTERTTRSCFGIVLSSPRVFGRSPTSTTESLNAFFRKRKIKVDKNRKTPYQFEFTRQEVESALENYRGVYGRIAAPALAMRFRTCSCAPRDLLQLCYVPLENVRSSDEEEAAAHEARLTLRRTIIRETLHGGGGGGEDDKDNEDEDAMILAGGLVDTDDIGSSGSESTETREKRRIAGEEFEAQRERMLKAELEADHRRKTVARYAIKALDLVLAVPKGDVEEDVKRAIAQDTANEDEVNKTEAKDDADDDDSASYEDDEDDEDDDASSSEVSSTTTSSGDAESDAEEDETDEAEVDDGGNGDLSRVPRTEKPLTFRERMLMKKVLRHRDRRLPHKKCVRVCAVAVRVRFTGEESEAKRDEEDQIQTEIDTVTDVLENWLRSGGGLKQLHESTKYHKHLMRSRLRDTQRELNEAKKNTRRTHGELMRIMERKYLYDDGLAFQRHRFSSDLEAKMAVDVATREFEHVKEVETNLEKEIKTIEVSLKRPHHLWTKECKYALRKKVARRTRKSVLRANRQEAAENKWRRPWDGNDGALFEKWKERYFRVRNFRDGDDDDEYDEYDLHDEYRGEDLAEDAAASIEGGEDAGEDDMRTSSEDEDADFSSSDSEILSDDTIDKHINDEGERVFFFDTDNEQEARVAKRP
eukprot:g738.t1